MIYIKIMENDGFIVIEGIHKNPNNINTLDEQTKIIHGPYNKKEAEKVAKGLIQKNIYIHMDEYIDNLRILKKHLEFHFKDKRQVSLLWSQTFICGQFMIQYLDEHID